MKAGQAFNDIDIAASTEDAEKITRIAAFIVSAHGEGAVDHAKRLEASSTVPHLAQRIRLEVERITQADFPRTAPRTGFSDADLD